MFKKLKPLKNMSDVLESVTLAEDIKPAVLHIYVSPDREMSLEDLKIHREFVFSEECRSVVKGLNIRIGERMDAALDESLDEKERYANIVCINELKDIILEWQNIAMEAKATEEDQEEEKDPDAPKKPTIKL